MECSGALAADVVEQIPAPTAQSPAGAVLVEDFDLAVVELQDLALLAGAELISPATGRQIQGIQASDLGRARRIIPWIFILTVRLWMFTTGFER